MSWYRKAQHGEWWIVDGSAEYADADTGEIGHEGIVLDMVRREIAETFGLQWLGEYYDWDEVKQECIRAYLRDQDEEDQKKLMKIWNANDEDEFIGMVPYESEIFDSIAQKEGIEKLKIDVADNTTDPRDYGMKELGWKRVAGNNIQTWTLTRDDLHSISNGIDDILGEFGQGGGGITYNIEVGSTGKMYTDVPVEVIENLSPMDLRKYEYSYLMYAKLKKKIKTAQMRFDPFSPFDSSTPQERQRIQELSDALDFAYEHAQFDKVESMEEELERLIESVTTRTEGHISEGYDVEGGGRDEAEEASLEELLAKGYHDYINYQEGYGPFNSKEDILQNMKGNVIMFGGHPEVALSVVLEAARDAYLRKKQLREREPVAAKKSGWYRRASLKKQASMTLHLEDFPYQEDLTTLGSASYKAQYLMFPYMNEFLEDDDFKAWRDRASIDWFTADGDDYFKNTGTINMYLPNVPEESIPMIQQTGKQILEKLNLVVSDIKADTSQMYDVPVLRYKIAENKNEKPLAPPNINLANANAYHLFRDILGYQEDLWDNGSFDVEELKKRIIYYLGESQYPESTPEQQQEVGQAILQGLWGQQLPGDEWKGDLGDMLSGRSGVSPYTQEDTRNQLQRILQFCDWSLSRGYGKAYLA